jgi:hypothetical protein
LKYLKMIGLAALTATAMTAYIGASAASATTPEIGGVVKNESITISGTLKSGSSGVLKTTSGASEQTCTQMNLQGKSASPYTGATLTGAVTTWTFGGCTNPVTVDKAGTLHITHIAGTTNGTVVSSGAEVTSFSAAIGAYINCKTGTGTHLGTVTGVKEGHATLHINAVLNCGFFLPSAKMEGTGTVTSPTGLGVVA